MKSIKYIISIILIALLYSCASNKAPIRATKFEGMSRVNLGDTIKIDWDFKNAHYVRIKDIPSNYKATDTLVFIPKRKTNLEFSAYNQTDTLKLTWRVYINEDSTLTHLKENSIVTYTAVKDTTRQDSSNFYPTSYSESKYFMGILQNPKNLIPDRIKIMGYDSLDDKSIAYKILLLDQFGNYIPDVKNDNLFIWKIENSCGDYNDKISTDSYKEKKLSDETTALNIIVDNSKAAEYNQTLLYNIKKEISNLNPNTQANLGIFNQDYSELVPFSNAKSIKYESLTIPKNDGLCAIYKNIYRNIADLRFVKDGKNKAIILITYSPNNAATIYNAKDVVDFARESRIPIYVIAIGSAIDSYSMKYISYGTGGRFYSLETNEIGEINKIINEINFSLNSHYLVNVPKPLASDCEFYTLNLKLNFNDRVLSAEGNYVNNPRWGGNSQQSLVVFDYKNTNIDAQYSSLIKSLSRVLVDNPQYSIELTGHSSIEDAKEEKNISISKERVDNVKEFFINLGVPTSQISTKYLGSSKPIYYLPSTEWQQNYNRRVEVNWIKPGSMPYEIIAQEYWTEEEAKIKANEWQSKGYRSYYERYLINNRASYKVKLWGYASREQAVKEAKKLEESYKFEFNVE